MTRLKFKRPPKKRRFHLKQRRLLILTFIFVMTLFLDVVAQTTLNADSTSGEKDPMHSDDMSWKTKNRSGVRFFANGLMGRYEEQNHLRSFTLQEPQFSDKKVSLNAVLPPEGNKPFVKAGVVFSIKEGTLFNIDLGASIASGGAHFGKTSSGAWIYSNSLGIFSLHSGINVTKRWYPYKLNIGIILDGNYLRYAGPGQSIDTNGVGFGNYQIFDAFNFSYGLRLGGEYLIGKHWGVNLDCEMIRSQFETVTKTNPYWDGAELIGELDYSKIIDIPPVGLGVGLTFYY